MTDEAPREPAKELKDYFFNMILYRQSAAVPAFLKQHPDAVHWRFSCNLTPLMEAVMQDHHEIAKMLLEAGAPVTDRADNGFHAMHYAGRSPNCIDLLLEHGADINMKTDNGGTALVHAVEHQHGQCAVMLIDRGADMEAVNWAKCTPLLMAASRGDARTCAALLKNGANMDARDNQGRNALEVARWGRDNNSANEKYLKTLDVLDAAYAAKTKEELRVVVCGIENVLEQGTDKPVTIGKALTFRQRQQQFRRLLLKM